MEMKSYGSTVRGINADDEGKISIHINFENISRVKLSILEGIAYEFLEKASKEIEKEG